MGGHNIDESEFEEIGKMKDGKHPNPNTIHPIAGYDKEIYVKPTITNPNIIVGDFTYIADSDFESHVSHLYEWNNVELPRARGARNPGSCFTDSRLEQMLQ